MTKGVWEPRVGRLLDPSLHPEFVYSFKPTDSAMYGGQPRLDYLACDKEGRFWGVEVKQSSGPVRTFNYKRNLSPGQQAGLTAVLSGKNSIALVALGVEDTLYVFLWETLLCLGLTAERIPLHQANLMIPWTGKKLWETVDLHRLVLEKRDSKLTEKLPSGSMIPSKIPPSYAASLTLEQRRMVEQLYKESFPPYSIVPVPPESGTSLTPYGKIWTTSKLPPISLSGEPVSDPSPGTEPNPMLSGPSSPATPPPASPSISKPKDSIRTRRRKLLSEL